MVTLQSSNTVGAYEAKTHLSELLEKVEAGEEITITKHGSPVAKLVPVKKKVSPEERFAAIERIQKLACVLSLRGFKKDSLTRAADEPCVCSRYARADNSHNCKDQSRASN